MTIAENLTRVKKKIADLHADYGLEGPPPQLIAVGKTHSQEAMRTACRAGQRCFGENRVMEAGEKWPPLRQEFSNIELHLIGALQSNKVKRALEVFDVIQSVDREKLARVIQAQSLELSRTPRLFVQINTGSEAQKSGIEPKQASEFCQWLRQDLQLNIEGLMGIPPMDESPAPYFALLVKIARENGIAKLSMGMSGDFPIAVKFGATHLRLGTAIFGTRTKTPIKTL